MLMAWKYYWLAIVLLCGLSPGSWMQQQQQSRMKRDWSQVRSLITLNENLLLAMLECKTWSRCLRFTLFLCVSELPSGDSPEQLQHPSNLNSSCQYFKLLSASPPTLSLCFSSSSVQCEVLISTKYSNHGRTKNISERLYKDRTWQDGNGSKGKQIISRSVLFWHMSIYLY